MSGLWALRPRVVRLHLSPRYRKLSRSESSVANSTSTNPRAGASRLSFWKRNRSPSIWSALGLALGLTGGNVVAHTIAPPAMPEYGTHEDNILIADLNSRIDNDFKVKVLRGKCLGVAKQLKGVEGGWVEVIPQPVKEATSGGRGLISQMQGAKALGVERLFWDKGSRRLVAIVWFGGAISGWPGVTHGGAIATALSDKAALAASLAEGSSTDVSAAAIPQRMPGTGNHAKMFAPTPIHDDPAQLSLSYVKPTYANNFYVIRVAPSIPLDQDSTNIVPSEPAGGDDYEVTLETMDARICVKAKVKFAPSNALQKVEDKFVETARNTYEDFKQWLWPSRQINLQTE